MDKTRGFTPASDHLIAEYNEPLIALVYGLVWRLWDMGGSCYAAQATIAHRLGISRKTVGRRLATLEKDGYIKRLTDKPGITDTWIPTGKINFRTVVQEVVNSEPKTESPNPADSESQPPKTESPIIKDSLEKDLKKFLNDDKGEGGETPTPSVAIATPYEKIDAITAYIQNVNENITPLESEDVLDLIKDHGEDNAKKAVRICVEMNARNLRYFKRVLENAKKNAYNFERGKPQPGENKNGNKSRRKKNGQTNTKSSPYRNKKGSQLENVKGRLTIEEL